MIRSMTFWGIAFAVALSVPTAHGQGGSRLEGQPGAPGRSPETTERRTEPAGTQSQGQAALQRAAEADKYVFLFFWKEKDRRHRGPVGRVPVGDDPPGRPVRLRGRQR